MFAADGRHQSVAEQPGPRGLGHPVRPDAPRSRIAKVAPWLNIDKDPYPAVVDGRVVWLIDGYTTSNSYPNSQRVDLATATSDSNTSWAPIGAERRDINYMRNSVKAVVDAYDGSVTLYAWDTEDPIRLDLGQGLPGNAEVCRRDQP